MAEFVEHKNEMTNGQDRDLQAFCREVRELSLEEKEKLASDTQLVSEFKRQKFEKEAQKNWDLFYKRNTTKFFKDRHWTTREFSELCDSKVILIMKNCRYTFILSLLDFRIRFLVTDISYAICRGF